MVKCEQCNKDYKPKRSASKYCSAKCRKLAFHAGTVSPENAKDENANSGCIGTVNPVPPILTVTPEGPKPEVPDNYGLENCECRHCQGIKVKSSKITLNHGEYKRSHELDENEVNRVSLPGDVDFEGKAGLRIMAEQGKPITERGLLELAGVREAVQQETK